MAYIFPGPSAPPQTVRAVNKTKNSIGVMWDDVPARQRNGKILKYTVNYHSGKPGDSIHEKTIDAPTLFATLELLTSNTKYNITVMASNKHGIGPASVPILVTTSNGSKF